MNQMTRIRWQTLAVLGILAVQSCGGDETVGPRSPVNIAFTTILQGHYWSCATCDSSAAVVLLFADAGSWSSFWETSERDIASAPGTWPPVVDFEHEVVLALLDEPEPRDSLIEIESVRRESDHIVVRATRRSGCWDEWLPAPPFRAHHIVRISRRLAPVDLFVTDVGCT